MLIVSAPDHAPTCPLCLYRGDYVGETAESIYAKRDCVVCSIVAWILSRPPQPGGAA